MKDERENENQSRIHILNFFSTSRFLSNGAKNDIFMALIGPDTKNVAVNPLLGDDPLIRAYGSSM